MDELGLNGKKYDFNLSDAYSKHKRNLLLSSFASLMLAFLGIEIQTISIFGSSAKVGEPDHVNVVVLVLLMYFVLRLIQHYRVEPHAAFGDVIKNHLLSAQDVRIIRRAKKYASHFKLKHPDYYLFRRVDELSNLKNRYEIIFPDEKIGFLRKRLYAVMRIYGEDEKNLFHNEESRTIKQSGESMPSWVEIGDPLERDDGRGTFLKIGLEANSVVLVYWYLIGILKYLFIDKYFSDFRLPFIFSAVSFVALFWQTFR